MPLKFRFKRQTLHPLSALIQTLKPEPKPSPELCSNATGGEQVHPGTMLISRQPCFSAMSFHLWCLRVPAGLILNPALRLLLRHAGGCRSQQAAGTGLGLQIPQTASRTDKILSPALWLLLRHAGRCGAQQAAGTGLGLQIPQTAPCTDKILNAAL